MAADDEQEGKVGARMAKPATAKRETGAACPICRRPAKTDFRPFCSKRCADVDLSRWLSGVYVIPGGGADADEDGDDDVALTAARSPSGRGDPTEENRG